MGLLVRMLEALQLYRFHGKRVKCRKECAVEPAAKSSDSFSQTTPPIRLYRSADDAVRQMGGQAQRATDPRAHRSVFDSTRLDLTSGP